MIEATKVRQAASCLVVGIECKDVGAQWGVSAILTDRTADYLELRASMKGQSDGYLLCLQG